MTTCPVCGQQPATDALSKTVETYRYDLARCPACRLLFVTNPPSEETLCHHYGELWNQGRLPERAAEAAVDRELCQDRFQRRLREITRHGVSGRLLDVGCNDGAFMRQARHEGWDVTGVELAPAAAAQARADGMTVVTGTLATAPLPEHHFDVVTVWHMIEHVTQPRLFLEQVRRVLKPAGLLALETPNVEGRAFRREGAAWEYLVLPQHLCYFGPHSLRLALERTGYDVVQTHCEGGTGVGLQLAHAGLGRMRLWLRRHYRFLQPLRTCYLFLMRGRAPTDDILIMYARPRQPSLSRLSG